MIIPVRCFTCNKVIANKWESYTQKKQESKDSNTIFNELGIKRFCCKRMIQSNYDTTDHQLPCCQSLQNPSTHQ